LLSGVNKSDKIQSLFVCTDYDYKVDTFVCPLFCCIYYFWRYKTISDLFINEQIRDKEVRVIGAEGEQLGVMSIQDAKKLAEEAGVDLVKIAPNAKPPVCRIVDYGKFKYEQLRKEKEAKKKQKTVEIKEIRLSPNIDTNDLNTKVNSAKKFLQKGNRVKVTLRFRGREMAHMGASVHILTDFAEALTDVAVIEKQPKVEGRSMTMFLTEKR
jgi:translation initiation factor IF-3